MAPLPYLASPGSIKTALDRIKAAATPDRVTGDFVTTKLQIKGGTGLAIPPFLKKIGLVASDGSPTDLYRRFRNSATSKAAIAQAIMTGYKPLAELNEYFYDLDDKKLLDLIIQATGAEADSGVAKATASTLKLLKSYADFEPPSEDSAVVTGASTNEVGTALAETLIPQTRTRESVGLNLSHTINLNLPATSDQAVFNAIFRSLKEHLLKDE